MIRTKDGQFEIEHQKDCWELRHYTPKKPTGLHPNMKPGFTCKRTWWATLAQAARRALDASVDRNDDVRQICVQIERSERLIVEAVNERPS
jgi:hypothetical protein